ncbi:MAG: flagellar biosynthesis protein FliQ [Lachnospiraceae bacterium]|nr:flagellar biosynthesis protein FliQ [Lachnospiraceae bacterium]
MSTDWVVDMGSEALFLIIKTAAPILLVSLAVGLIVSIFQTVTSIQEQTLTFIPKILAVFLTLMLLGGWILDSISGYMIELWSNFSVYIR